MSEEVFLKLEGVKKSFGGVLGLRAVNLKIRKARTTARPGKNAWER